MKLFTPLFAAVFLFAGLQIAVAQTKPAAKAPAKPAVGAKPAAKPVAKPGTAAAKPAAAKPGTAAKPAAAKPAAAVAAKPEEAPAAPSLITEKMTVDAPSSTTLKVRIDNNPVTKRLIVRTNATGPTRVEMNDNSGRPVFTRDIVSGDDVVSLDVSNLPAGTYIVQCTSGERRGMRRVVVGQ